MEGITNKLSFVIKKRKEHQVTATLHTALTNSQEEVVNRILSDRANEKYFRSITGLRLLFMAIINRNLCATRRLLEIGVPVQKSNYNTPYGVKISPLSLACYIGNYDIFNAVLVYDNDVDSTDTSYNWTPLMWACDRNMTDQQDKIFKKLLRLRANFTPETSTGATVLFWSFWTNHPNNTFYLIKRGVDLSDGCTESQRKQTALMLLMTMGYKDGNINLFKMILGRMSQEELLLREPSGMTAYMIIRDKFKTETSHSENRYLSFCISRLSKRLPEFR